jgi:hypothetical protein
MKMRRTGVRAREGSPGGDDASAVVGIDLRRPEHLAEHRLVHPSREEVGVERVDERVRLGVVAEEHLLRLDRGVDPALQQDRQLVAHLAAQRAEAAPQEVPHVVLEHQLVPRDPVELELGLEHVAHLGGAAGDDGEARVALRTELADQRRGPRDRLLLARLLQRRSHQLAKGVELRLEVGLVEVPAVDATRRPRVDAVRKCHRS